MNKISALSLALKGIGSLLIGASLITTLAILAVDLLTALLLLAVAAVLFLLGLWIYDKGDRLEEKEKKTKKKRKTHSQPPPSK